MKRQITYLLAVCMLSALLCGCGRSEKQTAGTKPTAPVQTAAVTEAPEPQTLGDIPDVDDIVRCYKELVNGNYGVEYDSSAPLPGGFDGAGEWYPVTNYGSLSELRRHVQQYLSDALMERIHSNYRKIISFNFLLICLGVAGVLPPATSALLHNASTLVISLKSMTKLLA